MSRLQIGYHASHEQFAPSELLNLVQHAEANGFDSAMSADHFQPWSRRQGQSGFSWSWLGAAMQATRLDFGALCVPGGWRYHPAVVAQAAATLADMFPDRLKWIAAGSGEALNERLIGAGWPDKAERNARLKAGVEIIRALWRGETVTRDGPIPVERASLFTRPASPPLILGAALTPETAHWLGGWADGLITVAADLEDLRAIVSAFRDGGGQGKPMVLQLHLSFADTDDGARAAAHDQWRTNAITPALSEALSTPDEYDDAAAHVRPEDMDAHVAISSDPARHLTTIEERLALGFDEIHLHNVGRNQVEFIETFGRDVLPALRKMVG
jgi:coenzyme F420-dependent glucose-6-phosphate dehydrogenase